MDPQTNETSDQPEAATATPPPNPVTTPDSRRGRLWPKILFGILLFFVLVWMVTPFLLSMDWVRAKVENGASESLGVPVTLANHDFGWFSGLTLEGVEIANPPQYSNEPAIALDRLEGDISAWRLLLGKVDLSGQVEGLRVRLEQNSDGSSNFGEIFNKPSEPGDEPNPEGSEETEDSFDLSKVRLDMLLHNGLVEVLQDGVLIESVTNLSVVAKKAFGGTALNLTLGADLERPSGSPGRIDLAVAADAAMEQPAVVDLAAKDVDLARYQTLLGSLLEEGALTHVEGVMGGALEATISGTDKIALQGELNVAQPRIAGGLVGGLDLQSASWVVRPTAKVELPSGKAPVANLQGFLLDLGFAKIEGLSEQATMALLTDGSQSPQMGLGIGFEVDLQAVLTMNDNATALPAGLTLNDGKVSGSFALPVQDQLPDTAEGILAVLQGAIDIQTGNLAYESWSLSGFGATAAVRQGVLSLDTSPTTKLNGGGLALHATANLNDPTIPTALEIKLAEVAVKGSGVDVLQYFLPLLAGAADAANLNFQGAANVVGTLQGPALMGEEHWLAWANHWTGKGTLGLGNSSFTPAPALQTLLSATGQGERLSLDGFNTKYSISDGAVATNLGKLSKLSSDVGLEGKVGLDGTVDYKIDFTEWMAQHRDGKRILDVLGDTRLQAGLNGTLTSPRLAMPDMTQLLLQAGQNAIENELRGKVDDALQKGLGGALDKIFGGKKK